MAYSEDFQTNAVIMLQQYIFPELSSENGFMKARACWVYGEFAHYLFNHDQHLREALNGVY